MEAIKYLKYIIVLLAGLIFGGCGVKYTKHNDTMIKNAPWNNTKEYRSFNKKNKNITFDGFKIEFYQVKPYLSTTYGHSNGIALRSTMSIIEQYSRSYSKWFYEYTFLILPINKNPYNKKLQAYYNQIDVSYETKLIKNNINKFVEYPCDKNIIFDDEERDENLNPLKATCYAKRLDNETFLITRFAHPNTKKDTELFDNEIIPTMLKSIKVTPTKISPWKYN